MIKLILKILCLVFCLQAQAEYYENIELNSQKFKLLLKLTINGEYSLITKTCRKIPKNQMKSVEVIKDKSNKKIKFWYQHIRVSNSQSSNLPTIVYIPGGPGRSSMNSYKYSTIFKLLIRDKLANIIFIDPIGIGCNWLNPDKLTPEVVSTKQAAKHISKVIEHEQLDNYYIYGGSYGTQLGTVLASMISKKENMPKPKKLVLEGVTGTTKQIFLT